MRKRTQQPNPAASEEPFTFSSGPPYADKSEYIEKDLAFSVLAIELQQGRGFEGADRWALTVEASDGRGAELITFGCNEKRDAQLHSAKIYIEKHGAIASVHLRKSGNAYYLENAIRKAS